MMTKQQTMQLTSLLEKVSKLISNGQLKEAAIPCEQAFKLAPDDADALLKMGELRYHQGKLKEAAPMLEHALAKYPKHEGIRTLLFATYKDSNQLEPMIAIATRFLEQPLNASEIMHAFSAFLHICDWQHAYALADQVFSVALDNQLDHRTLLALLMASNGMTDVTPELSFRLHQAWGKKFTPSPPLVRNIQGRISIAYVSGDFRRHPVGYFMAGVISSHHREIFEVYCYAQMAGHCDDISEQFARNAEHFIDITDMDDAALAARMQQDGIDIAVDLSSHTFRGRTAAFARRLAPVQISYLGYPNTTGLEAMDFHITDHFAQDLEQGTRYTEKLLYMPNSFLCYGISQDVEKRTSAPCEERGIITFASFNDSRKLNPDVIEVWSHILKRVEKSRLLLKFIGSDQLLIQSQIISEFSKHGIDSGRITFLTRTTSENDHIRNYHMVDIALDPFPYTGTTTTCEALSQGVPVITMVGPKHCNRVSYSILKNIGFEETITFNRDEYIDKATSLAGKPKALSILRETLPLLLQYSPLCQIDTFVSNLEELYKHACTTKSAICSSEQTSIAANNKNKVPDFEKDSKESSRRLHIGGKEKHPDWEILDAIPSELTDHIGNANDLSMFPDSTFEAVYSSHVLEHFSYQNELAQVLAEWHRVLKPGGMIFASVPNMDVLCELFLNKHELSAQDRFLVMRMMFGGQIDPYDFHKVGYNPEILGSYLAQSGFENIRMVTGFGLFSDTSNMEFAGKRISLNLIAEKPLITDDLAWLCSYPKSGNTMVRIAVENYFNQPTLSVYRHVTKGDNSPLFGDDYTNAIGIKCHKVSEVPQHARMVYIYRDPRDVLISSFKWNTGQLPHENETQFNDFLPSALHEWKSEITQAQQFFGNKLLVRYEDIISNPIEAYSRIFTFMQNNTAINTEQLEKTIRNTTKEKAFQWFEKLGANHQVMPTEQKTTRWAELLTTDQIEEVASILGKSFLTQLGYAISIE